MPRYDNQAAVGSFLVPSTPFICCLSGQIGAGKSSTMLGMLLDKDKLFQKFHRLILISPTLDLDEKMELLMEKENLCLSNQKLQDVQFEELSILDQNHKE